mmetsp:Transcript_15728/g.27962  ORF Transcript_15728/g.27962 Transcript_15728/m.27962 type:complete len:432 (+) Transcript_15728:114-1409(+)
MLSFIKRKGKKKTAAHAGEDDDVEMSDVEEVQHDTGKDAEETAVAPVEDIKVDHGLETAQLKFMMQCSSDLVENESKLRADFIDKVNERNMVALYLTACEQGLVTKDESLLKAMRKANEKELEELREKEKDAEENHGEIEVMEALLKTADFFALTSSKQDALDAYDKVAALKSMSTGQLIDVVLKKIMLGFFWMDTELTKLCIQEAEKLLERGGDWDRRNRLKVYRGLYSLVSRNFEKASEDFLSAVATFTTSELCSYETFIFYTVMASIVALNRVEFKEKVIDSPDVLSVLRDVPHLGEFMNTLHDCDYKGFFASLVHLNSRISTDRYLSVHRDWFFREVRVRAYAQFLESYKSVTMKSMSSSFGVSPQFMDKELSHFISTRRINAKIDKVAGVIETCQPNETNARYQSVIRQGDLLLNRVQMLSRAINV